MKWFIYVWTMWSWTSCVDLRKSPWRVRNVGMYIIVTIANWSTWSRRPPAFLFSIDDRGSITRNVRMVIMIYFQYYAKYYCQFLFLFSSRTYINMEIQMEETNLALDLPIRRHAFPHVELVPVHLESLLGGPGSRCCNLWDNNARMPSPPSSWPTIGLQ